MTIIERCPQKSAAETPPPQLLFPEANRRRRRRRLALGLAALIFVMGAASAVTVLALRPSPDSSPTLPSLPSSASTPVETIPRVAWSDYQGNLHLGSLNGLSENVVAHTDADPTTSLLAVGNSVFWVRSMLPTPDGTVNPIVDSTVQRLDPATGTVTTLGPGTQVFASPDHSLVYVDTASAPFGASGDELAEFTPNGLPIRHNLHLPSGWFLSDSGLLGDPTPAIANGILVQSDPVQIGKNPPTLAIWDPANGRVQTVGRVWKVIGTYTKQESHGSLIAWLPGRCEVVRNCPLEITNSSTLVTRSVYSPYGHGFEWGGGFSPNGSTLAAFVPGSWNLSPTARLVLVTGSGQVHKVPAATINNGDSLAWAAWFPDSRHLIVGGLDSPEGVPNDNHYVVNAVKRSATPFRFISDEQSDINFSVAILPRGSN